MSLIPIDNYAVLVYCSLPDEVSFSVAADVAGEHSKGIPNWTTRTK